MTPDKPRRCNALEDHEDQGDVVLDEEVPEVFIRYLLELVTHQEGEAVDVLECNRGAFGYGVQRVIGDMNRQLDHGNAFVQAPSNALSGEVDARLVDVRRQLRWCLPQCVWIASSIFEMLLSKACAIST